MRLLYPERMPMYSSRRVFIGASFWLAASASADWAAQQGGPASQLPPPFSPPEPPELPRNQKRNRAMLKANRDAIDKDVNRMSELIGALQKQLKESDNGRRLTFTDRFFASG
jgi:hypothetical protein